MRRNRREHPHPCEFRLLRTLDKGWGEMAFEYGWNSDSGIKEPDGSTPDLAHCFLYEVTTYAGNTGRYQEGYLFPPDPPFMDWKFRDPTDGRNAPVALGRFSAVQGWAWDRHKLGGRLLIPETGPAEYRIIAMQEYRFHCEVCGADSLLFGPHPIERRFFQQSAPIESGIEETCWRYLFQKHNTCAFLDISRKGYVADSAGIGFGPW